MTASRKEPLPPDLWCAGPILEAVQRARVFADSKDFVDSPLRPEISHEEALRRWALLPHPIDDAAVRAFVLSTFSPPGSDLEHWTPPDFTPTPPLLLSLRGEAKAFAEHLNGLWPLLGRRAKTGPLVSPEPASGLQTGGRVAPEPPLGYATGMLAAPDVLFRCSTACPQGGNSTGGDRGGTTGMRLGGAHPPELGKAHPQALPSKGEAAPPAPSLVKSAPPPPVQPPPPALVNAFTPGPPPPVSSPPHGEDAPIDETAAVEAVAPPPLGPRSSLLPPRSGFVVPGGRFRELYYWDSLWVVLGLLAVGMRQTAEGMCDVLLDQVSEYGFVPNGARSYYLNRSQPPLLTQMVASLVGLANVPRGGAGAARVLWGAGVGGNGARVGLRGGATAPLPRRAHGTGGGHAAEPGGTGGGGSAGWPGDTGGGGQPGGSREWRVALLRRALPLLDREYGWWMRGGEDGSAVRLGGGEYRRGAGRHAEGPRGAGGGDGGGCTSCAECDAAGCAPASPPGFPPPAVLNRYVVGASGPRPESWREDVASAEGMAGDARLTLFRELAAGAATGWDYSTRWEGEAEGAAERGGEWVGAGAAEGEGMAGGSNGRPGAWRVVPVGAAATESPFDLRAIRTSQIVPVELNAILYANEVSLSRMHALLRDDLVAIAAETDIAAQTGIAAETGIAAQTGIAAETGDGASLADRPASSPFPSPSSSPSAPAAAAYSPSPPSPFPPSPSPPSLFSPAAAAAASASYAEAAAARRLAIQNWMWATTENPPAENHSSTSPPPRYSSASSPPPHSSPSAPPLPPRPPPGRWHDLDLNRGGARLPGVSAASFTPLWAAVHTSPAQAAAAVDALAGSGLIQVGGLATTLRPSGQQWDWPNGWPPLQQMIILGLGRSGDARGEAMGAALAAAWLKSNYAGWRQNGGMHEKYDVTQIGRRGGGGEYEPQVGFGWTNGVVLWLLCEYGGGAIEEYAAAECAMAERAAKEKA